MFSHFPEHFQFMEIKLIFNFTKAHTVSAFHNQGREERRLELHQKFCSCDAVILKVRCFFWESSYSNSIHSLNFLEFHFPSAENKSFLILRQVNSFEIPVNERHRYGDTKEIKMNLVLAAYKM